MSIETGDVKKIGKGYRTLSGFMFFCSLFAVGGMFAFSSKEDLTLLAIPLYLVPLLMLYVTAKITFTGYPPKYLLWTMERK